MKGGGDIIGDMIATADAKTVRNAAHHNNALPAMPNPRVLILRAPGTNCEFETAFAFEAAGAESVEILHVNRLLESPAVLHDAQILCIPGGFSFGDDIAAGRIFASKLENHLPDAFRNFRDAGKLILGICNGFQVLLKSGLLFEDDGKGPKATLTWNRVPLYTDRWVRLRADSKDCVFLRGIDSLYLPIAHAEGRFATSGEADLKAMKDAGQFVLRYLPEENPNGSDDDVAGVCDATGRVFGLMPHPERYIEAVQHPHWTRRHTGKELRESSPPGDGLALFKNAVDYFQG